MTKYAAIGSDGTREVVWGLGDTAEAAESEACQAGRDSGCDPELVRTVEVTPAQAARIQAGEVGARDLGI